MNAYLRIALMLTGIGSIFGAGLAVLFGFTGGDITLNTFALLIQILGFGQLLFALMND